VCERLVDWQTGDAQQRPVKTHAMSRDALGKVAHGTSLHRRLVHRKIRPLTLNAHASARTLAKLAGAARAPAGVE